VVVHHVQVTESDAELDERRRVGQEMQRTIPQPSRPVPWVMRPLWNREAEAATVAGTLRAFAALGPIGILVGVPAALLVWRQRRRARGKSPIDWRVAFFGRRP
jgi:hypothetical protein